MSGIVGFSEDDFPRVVRVIRAVESGGMEHPFYQQQSAAGMEMLTGKSDSAITKGNAGTISVWDGTSTTLSDTTMNVTAYARLGDIESGKWVYLLPTSHGFEVIAAEC